MCECMCTYVHTHRHISSQHVRTKGISMGKRKQHLATADVLESLASSAEGDLFSSFPYIRFGLVTAKDLLQSTKNENAVVF